MIDERQLTSLNEDLENLALNTSLSFETLAHAAGLDPGKDFIDADLRGADLRGQDLRSFDLSDADVTDAQLEGTQFNPDRAPVSGHPPQAAPQDQSQSWKIISTDTTYGGVPNWALELMAEIRGDGIYEVGPLLHLLERQTGYRRRGLIKRMLPSFRKFNSCPRWLREFILEVSVMKRTTFVKDLIEECVAENVIEPFSEIETLCATATWSEFVSRRADAVKRLGQEYGAVESIKDIVLDFALNDRSCLVRRFAVEALPVQEFDEEYIKPLLYGIMEEDDDNIVQSNALFMLSYFRHVDSDVMELLLNTALHGESAMKGAAMRSLEHDLGLSEDLDEFIVGAINKTLTGTSNFAYLSAISVARRNFQGNRFGDYLFKLMSEEGIDDIKLFYLFSALVDCVPSSPHIRDALDLCLNTEGTRASRESALKFLSGQPELVKHYRDQIFQTAELHPGQVSRRATFLALSLLPDERAKLLFLQKQFERIDNHHEKINFYNTALSHFKNLDEGETFLEMVKEKYPDVAI
ncbi:pentapeptide repeat-containing protein [Maritalea myrionectae]|uniref:pentapeptide repeat-containing protein n=1 Tax=Maritalea myrionectae TaxID=454601 RepID=UPI00040502F8|nr:pentapeptide repeat-containing protein [Maritalea myrionectae]